MATSYYYTLVEWSFLEKGALPKRMQHTSPSEARTHNFPSMKVALGHRDFHDRANLHIVTWLALLKAEESLTQKR